jgi:nitrite reductase/ring-hydroxylating ferredoxin subunit
MLVNLGAVALFIGAWLLRGQPEAMPGLSVVGLELAGVALLTAGGWMGGVLVNRNLIGVDHRYARAGKWKEEQVEPSSGGPVVVGRVGELEVDQMKLLRIDGRRLVLARTKEGYVVFDDRCTHRGGSLAGGVMIGGVVQCLWHGSQFDCRSGAVRAGPTAEPIKGYSVSERNGSILLTLDNP